MIKTECSECRFFQSDNDIGGSCFLNPPVMFLQKFKGESEEWEEVINYRPHVNKNDYCSSFSHVIR